MIFKGEIQRAFGGVQGGSEAFGDTILFTTDDDILAAVSKNDSSYISELESDDSVEPERPTTADADERAARPLTRAHFAKMGSKNVQTPRPNIDLSSESGSDSDQAVKPTTSKKTPRPLSGRPSSARSENAGAALFVGDVELK